MNDPEFRLFFDYVDPASFLVEEALVRALPQDHDRVFRHGLELRPPPEPLLDARDPEWTAYAEQMSAAALELDIELTSMELIPWTRKAHELALHAREKGAFHEVHRALLTACHVQGRDLGRIDVLVELAAEHGLDRTETKAVLDVDRHAGTVEELRLEAERLEVRRVPTLLAGHGRLEGYHDPEAVRDFLAPAS